MNAELHAQNAYSEVLALLLDIQSLEDSQSRGVPVRYEDLQHLHSLAAFIRYHVSRAQYAISREQVERREVA